MLITMHLQSLSMQHSSVLCCSSMQVHPVIVVRVSGIDCNCPLHNASLMGVKYWNQGAHVNSSGMYYKY